jgi:hypothetical protein
MNRLCLIGLVACLLVLAAGAPGRAEELRGGEWQQRYDEGVDGKIKDTVREPTWRVTVQKNKISGTLASTSPDGEHRFEGTVTNGRIPIVRLRHTIVGNTEWERFYVGQFKDGRIVGTWYQNDGPSGDFEFIVGKK